MICPGLTQTVIFVDDFESYDTGTVPGEPWVTPFPGASSAISEVVAASGFSSGRCAAARKYFTGIS
jgi:hypothetical protein